MSGKKRGGESKPCFMINEGLLFWFDIEVHERIRHQAYHLNSQSRLHIAMRNLLTRFERSSKLAEFSVRLVG